MRHLMLRGPNYCDEEVVPTNTRWLRSTSALPDSGYLRNALEHPTRALSLTRDDVLEDSTVICSPRFTTQDTLARLGDILGRGDDSWLDRYVSNVRAPNSSRLARVSRVGREFPLRRRFLTSAYYPYKNSLPGFYTYPKEHHWSYNDPTSVVYQYSTPSPASNIKEWDWAYPHRSYTSNYSPTYIHYPRDSSHRYLYSRKF